MTVETVSQGQTITPEWGNSVANDLNAITPAGAIGTTNLANGAVTAAKLGASVFTRAASQSIANSGSLVNISWTGETQDPDGWGTVTTDTLTCPTTGAYVCIFEVEWASTPTAGSHVYRQSGGSSIETDTNLMVTGPPRIVTSHLVAWFRAGNTLQLAVSHTTGAGAINVTAKLCIMRFG